MKNDRKILERKTTLNKWKTTWNQLKTTWNQWKPTWNKWKLLEININLLEINKKLLEINELVKAEYITKSKVYKLRIMNNNSRSYNTAISLSQ